MASSSRPAKCSHLLRHCASIPLRLDMLPWIQNSNRSSKIGTVCAAAFLLIGAAQCPASDIDYNRDIAPILADKCYQCHGPDANQRQAGLRLDTQDGATSEIDSGNIPIVAGDVAASEVIARITSTDPDVQMPPSDHKQQLSDSEKRLIQQWIASGAKWQQHWSLVRFKPVSPPTVSDQTWRRNPIDDFILTKLESQQLTPAPTASKQTLVRRLYFDILGMPPTRAEAATFLNDHEPDAYNRLVDRLFASPHYGERWGRHWLDVARYGDSNGGDENHAYPHAFRYRNYVIDTWNRDLPYDQFLHEQIAGDLLDENAARTQNAGSKSNRWSNRAKLPGLSLIHI